MPVLITVCQNILKINTREGKLDVEVVGIVEQSFTVFQEMLHDKMHLMAQKIVCEGTYLIMTALI